MEVAFSKFAQIKVRIGPEPVYRPNGNLVGFRTDDGEATFRFQRSDYTDVEVSMDRDEALEYAKSIVKALEFDA